MTPEEKVRQHLVEALEADLVGPFIPDGQSGGGEEVLPLPPSRWYLTGFLAPQGGRAPDADDEEAEGDLAAGSESRAEDAGTDDPDTKRPKRFPASMGLSVFLPPSPKSGDADFLHVTVRYADYIREDVFEDNDRQTKSGWRRIPRGPFQVEVPLNESDLAKGIRWPGSPGLCLKGELRVTDIESLMVGTRVLSLFLVNERETLVQNSDLNFIFQAELTFHYEGGFVPRPNRRGESSDDADQRVAALMFRNHFEWAVGHNTSVAGPIPDETGIVRTLHTTQLPQFEVRPVKPNAILGVETKMRCLSDLDGEGLKRSLSPLIEAYGEWIEKQRYAHLGNTELEKTRDSLMDEAARARERIKEGIALLVENDEVRESFRLANLAMHVAALQMDIPRADKRYKEGRQPAWRPFQLAFFLMNLASTADSEHADRKTADLIYFPTGGGKTEAYLGLIAYTLILRRLRGKKRLDEGRGVAVILRYTLRLLTLDQLGRAATLMCALEELRNRDPKRLGNARFSVGLWVGQSATANRLKEVHQALHDFSPGAADSPFPLTVCPWCGEEIKMQSIKLVGDDGKPSKTKFTRAVVYCQGKDCLFTERKRPGQGLPVLFVDEQIYNELPDFLVATVDKFAMLPWRSEAGRLFGRVTHLDQTRAYGVTDKPPKNAVLLKEGLYPPQLIVQDELHLISGPLGTMVGLYETAVGYLSERTVDGLRRSPKIICSTATVRRAKDQIRALFNRDTAIFPPRGIDDGDNFFAGIDKKSFGRLYVGIAAPGRALRAVSVRAYTTLLAAAEKHFDPNGPPNQPADPYMTLVGYFNSLRELGGMRRLVEDEVRIRVKKFADDKRPHHFVGPHPFAANRELIDPGELTSRENTDNVKKTKDRLGKRRVDKDRDPLDVVLASNMISVGLDVDRLGLMVVTGQPKTSGEYIQATSRVGRAYPGLVVTCLNVNRPRDRSHFERFSAYHESFYREVEATSVTPFSLQTLDRGMVGTLISMIRHGILEMEPPRGFMALHENRARAEEILEMLVRRGREHREWHDADAEERIKDELRARGKHFLDAWERIVDKAHKGAADRIYSGFDRPKDQGKAVMYTPVDDRPAELDERLFMAPTSMRDVEFCTHIWRRYIQLDERH